MMRWTVCSAYSGRANTSLPGGKKNRSGTDTSTTEAKEAALGEKGPSSRGSMALLGESQWSLQVGDGKGIPESGALVECLQWPILLMRQKIKRGE